MIAAAIRIARKESLRRANPREYAGVSQPSSNRDAVVAQDAFQLKTGKFGNATAPSVFTIGANLNATCMQRCLEHP
jgi:hypothetical protein